MREIILPQEIDSKITGLSRKIPEEVHGTMLYLPAPGLCLIDYVLVTGMGTERYVQTIPDRESLLEEFFQRNPGYRSIEFHTHSRRTIEQYGSDLTVNFSSGDLVLIRQKMAEDSEYLHLLFTPTAKKIAATDEVKGIVVNNTIEGYKKRVEAVRMALETIAQERRVDLSFFPGTEPH